MTDLSDFDTTNSTAVLHLKDPRTGGVIQHDDGRPFTIEFRSPDSKEAISARDAAVSYSRLIHATGSPAAIRNQMVEIMSKATVGWDFVYHGEVPTFTPAKAQEIYKAQPWLFEQVAEFASDRVNFIRA